MATSVTPDLCARFAALATLPCPACGGRGQYAEHYGPEPTDAELVMCQECGGTRRKYPILSTPEWCVCQIHVSYHRSPLPLDTPADRQRAVGVLMEVLSAHDNVQVSWYRRQMFIHRDTVAEPSAECIAKGPNLGALVIALEAVEGNHDAN